MILCYEFHIKILLFFFIEKTFQECDPEVQKHRVLLYILLFIGFGLIILTAMFLQVCSTI
jgi:hypothetical protein